MCYKKEGMIYSNPIKTHPTMKSIFFSGMACRSCNVQHRQTTQTYQHQKRKEKEKPFFDMFATTMSTIQHLQLQNIHRCLNKNSGVRAQPKSKEAQFTIKKKAQYIQPSQKLTLPPIVMKSNFFFDMQKMQHSTSIDNTNIPYAPEKKRGRENYQTIHKGLTSFLL